MSLDVYMNPPVVEEMRQIFADGSNTLLDLNAILQDIVAELCEGNAGALLGQGGDALADAIQEVLTVKIANLQAKFVEIDQDLNGAIQIYTGVDQMAASRFGGRS